MPKRIQVSANVSSLQKNIKLGRNGKAASKLLKQRALEHAEEKQRKLIEEFESHPVTSEINGGPNASNSSQTLGGYGNLFSFIGFDAGSDPIGPIVAALSKKINVQVKSTGGKFLIKYNVVSPEDIFNVTPMPWAEGRSWAQGIELGISGLGQYFRGNFKSSRSGGGIQSSGKRLGGVRFKNLPYISRLLRDFQETLKKND